MELSIIKNITQWVEILQIILILFSNVQSANGVIENFFCKNVDICNFCCTIFSIFSPLCNLMKKMAISCFTWRFTQSYHFFYFYLWGWFWLQHLLIAARIVKVPDLLPFPNIFPNLKSEWIQYIINSIQKLHIFKKCYQNSETQLTLKSRMPSLWNAHLALAWTKRLGIFLPEFLQRFLHHQSSVSNLSVWIFVWRRPPCTTGWAKKKI